VGEPRSNRPRTCRLEYRFDRLLPEKLAQVYQLLVPEKRRPVAGSTEKLAASPESGTEMRHEQTSRYLRPSFFGSTEGEPHDCQPDGSADRMTHGYEVPPEWVFQDEGYSGAILVRPGLEALRDLAAEGQIVAALIYSPDRLSRKYAYQVLLSEE